MAIGTTEWILIIAVLVLLFGATAIPKLARAMGRAQGEFSKAQKEFKSEARRAEAETEGAGPSEAQIRQTARDLGIEEEGMELDQVKQAINEKVG